MVASLNFGLLQPLDLTQAVQAFDQSRARRMQGDAMAQEQQARAAQIQREQAKLDQQKMADDAIASWFESQAGENAPLAPAAAPTAPATPAPMSAPMEAPAAPVAASEQPGDDPMMTVTAARDKPNPMRFLADMARAGQGQMAMQLFDRSRTMAKDERAAAVGAYDAMAAATQSLAGLPYEQRRNALVQMAPALVQRGVPANMIEAFDPTDEALAAARDQALGIVGVLQQEDRVADNARADAQFAETQRANRTRESLTVRGQNMVDRRAAQKNQIDATGVSLKLTEGQGKATGFLRLAQQAEQTLSQAGATVPGEGARMAYGVPFAERLVGDDDRKVLAAQEAFTEASLRFLTGAAVTRDEARRNVTQFFPSPGDTPEVVQQKAAYRQQVMAGMRDAAGPGATKVQTQRPAQPAPASGAPRAGTVVDGWRFKGGDPARRTNWERAR